MENENNIFFNIGDIVQFNMREDLSIYVIQSSALYQNEPLRVVEVQNVPETLLRGVGHHQWIWVSPCDDAIREHWSGAWFMKA